MLLLSQPLLSHNRAHSKTISMVLAEMPALESSISGIPVQAFIHPIDKPIQSSTDMAINNDDSTPHFTCAQRNEKLSERDGSAGWSGRLRIHGSDDRLLHVKLKHEFHCLDCGAGRAGGWLMQFHNVCNGAGCPVCRFSKEIAQDIVNRFPGYRLVTLANAQGRPKASMVRYQVVPHPWALPEDFGWEPKFLKRSTIPAALREDRRPGEEQCREYEVSVETRRVFMDAFPKGNIRFSGKMAPGTTTPGPFFAIDTGSRLMRQSVCLEHIRSQGILKICRQEKSDSDLDKVLRAEADGHSAIIDGYETVEPLGLKIKYQSRTNFTRFDTPARAREVLWGQTKCRKGEKLCAAIMAELFPANDWVHNRRYAFLCCKSVKGDDDIFLELDGYSPGQRLAFEYQGVQHFEARSQAEDDKLNLALTRQRDAFKVQRCKTLGIDLVVVPSQELDLESFMLAVSTVLSDLARAPTHPDVQMEVIWTRWNDACQNPLAAFQQEVITNLGEHALVAPIRSRIAKKTQLVYRCSVCNALNTVEAKNLALGNPRRYCPKCKGGYGGIKRRNQMLTSWRDDHLLPDAFIENLKFNSEPGAIQYRCVNGHLTLIHHLDHAKRHTRDGSFECPECRSAELGVPRNQVAQQANCRQSFNDDLTKLGLKLIEYLPPRNGEMSARVKCASERHTFELARSQVSAMLAHACLNDQNIIPSACPGCCYPGVDVDASRLLRGTVFHRLASLRGMYPQVSYLDSFDPKGRQAERYSCGEYSPDGRPHPPISISWRNLQKTGKRSPLNHLCAACGLQAGQVGFRSKRLADLVVLMLLMRDELQKYTPAGSAFHPPEVWHVDGPLNPVTQEVSTTKTKLRFWCGHPDHPPTVATKDYYFNRAPARGYGFCKQCVIEAKLTKAPMPFAATQSVHALMPPKLREAQ